MTDSNVPVLEEGGKVEVSADPKAPGSVEFYFGPRANQTINYNPTHHELFVLAQVWWEYMVEDEYEFYKKSLYHRSNPHVKETHLWRYAHDKLREIANTIGIEETRSALSVGSCSLPHTDDEDQSCGFWRWRALEMGDPFN